MILEASGSIRFAIAY